MKIYLIRHGETKSNKEKRYLGMTDEPLSIEGEEGIISKKKAGLYPEYDGQLFYTSGLVRTKQTLSLIYGDVEYTEEACFNESDFGIFEGKTYEELKDDPQYIAWISGDNLANKCPGGESFNDMKARVIKGYKDILNRHKDDGRDIIIVTHGGPIVALMQYLHPESDNNFYDWSIKPGEILSQVHQ